MSAVRERGRGRGRGRERKAAAAVVHSARAEIVARHKQCYKQYLATCAAITEKPYVFRITRSELNRRKERGALVRECLLRRYEEQKRAHPNHELKHPLVCDRSDDEYEDEVNAMELELYEGLHPSFLPELELDSQHPEWSRAVRRSHLRTMVRQLRRKQADGRTIGPGMKDGYGWLTRPRRPALEPAAPAPVGSLTDTQAETLCGASLAKNGHYPACDYMLSVKGVRFPVIWYKNTIYIDLTALRARLGAQRRHALNARLASTMPSVEALRAAVAAAAPHPLVWLGDDRAWLAWCRADLAAFVKQRKQPWFGVFPSAAKHRWFVYDRTHCLFVKWDLARAMMLAS